jgi:subtilisin family serine protease
MHKRLYLIVAITLLLSMIAPTALAQDETPTRRTLVSPDGIEAQRAQPLLAPDGGLVPVVVHLDTASLATVGESMLPQQRAEYAVSVARLQDQVAAQIQALDGRVVGRFKTLSSGLAVEIDAARIEDLLRIPGVVDVRRVHHYQMDLSETVPWIGADAVQNAGFDGTGVTVAVIDSGVDYTHAKLGGPGTTEDYAAAYCGDPAAIPDPNDPTCDAYDFADATGLFPNTKVVGGYDYVGDQWPFGPQSLDPNPIDFDGHGTHVADIIGGLPLRDPALAWIRVAHLSPDAPNVDVLVNDGVAFADVPFQEITEYAGLPPGTYNVKVVPAGATTPVVIEADLTLEAGNEYTVAAVNLLADIEPLVLVDDNTPPAAGDAHVRFLHASPDAPAVDIAVAGGGPVLFSDVEFKEVSDYLPLAAGTYDLEVRLVGTTTIVLPLPGITLTEGEIYTAYAVGQVGAGTLGAVLSVDFPGGVGQGVAPGVSIYGFKACSAQSTACNGLALLLSIDAAADLDDDPATFDPVDVINMSLGALYGQPEDDLTAFTNEITLLGTIVVAAAGNGSNKPFIVDSPSAATAAIGVAQTTVPSAALFKIRRNAPEPVVIIEEAVFQPWSSPLAAPITADVVYGNGDETNLDGCEAFTADLTGKVSLVDRGDCFFSDKVQNAEAAGAVLSIIAQNSADPPFPGGFGAGTPPTIPGFMISRADGELLKEPDTNITMDPTDPDLSIPLPDTMVGSSSRGPRNHDNYIKPDIGAPGASISAEVGTGTGTTAFGGTSGATPMVAGTAALLKQKYAGTPLPGYIRYRFGAEMPVWMYKALLMNTAETEIWQDVPGGMLAPITSIGGGRVDALSAFDSETIAWDNTEAWKDPRYRTGSFSFSYQAVSSRYVKTRRGIVVNLSDHGRWYNLSSAFRYTEDENLGVSVTISPERLWVPAHGWKQFTVKLKVEAQDLRPWDLVGVNKGPGGADGDAFAVQEYDGYITIDGGEHNTVHLPWHVLPKRAARVWPVTRYIRFNRPHKENLRLRNYSQWQDGDVDVYSLVDVSPNIYDYRVSDDIEGACTSVGLDPGCNQTRIDLKEVGVRHLPFVFDDGLIEFGLTIWDRYYRAGEYPVGFDIYVDSPADGLDAEDADGDTDDFLVENGDLGQLTGGGVDGRNVVAVFDLAAGTGSIYFFTDSGFNTRNWILTVPTFELGLQPGDQFRFRVEAWDQYFTGSIWDCSPGDCTSYHTYTAGVPKYDVDDPFPVVPADGKFDVTVTRGDKARVRVAHLSPDAPNVDILVNDALAFADIPFQEITGYAMLPPGTYNVKVVPAGATEPVVIEADLTLEAGTDYTVAAVNVLASIEPLVLVDDNSDPAAGESRVRFVHAAPSAPAVDIAVTGGPILFSDIEFKEVGDYLAVAAGTYDLEARLAGTDTVVLSLPGVTVEDGKVYTVYAVDEPEAAALAPVDGDGVTALISVDRGAQLIGATASPSQIGLLLMYRQAPVARESTPVIIKP